MNYKIGEGEGYFLILVHREVLTGTITGTMTITITQTVGDDLVSYRWYIIIVFFYSEFEFLKPNIEFLRRNIKFLRQNIKFLKRNIEFLHVALQKLQMIVYFYLHFFGQGREKNRFSCLNRRLISFFINDDTATFHTNIDNK